jgi:hypothetical protein
MISATFESNFRRNFKAQSVLHSRNFQLDTVHTRAGRNVERLALVAPGHIAHGLGDFDCAEVLEWRHGGSVLAEHPATNQNIPRAK